MKQVLMLLALCLFGCVQNTDVNIGIEDNKLLPCKFVESCYSSLNDKKGKYYIEPIQVLEPNPEVIKKIKSILEKYEDIEIHEITPRYIHATFSIYDIIDFNAVLEFFVPVDDQRVMFKAQLNKALPDFDKLITRIEEIKFNFVQNRM